MVLLYDSADITVRQIGLVSVFGCCHSCLQGLHYVFPSSAIPLLDTRKRDHLFIRMGATRARRNFSLLVASQAPTFLLLPFLLFPFFAIRFYPLSLPIFSFHSLVSLPSFDFLSFPFALLHPGKFEHAAIFLVACSYQATLFFSPGGNNGPQLTP